MNEPSSTAMSPDEATPFPHTCDLPAASYYEHLLFRGGGVESCFDIEVASGKIVWAEEMCARA